MLVYYNIKGKGGINAVDQEKVEELKKSILENGWQGCPILIYGDELLTGSHRLEALKQLADYEGDEDIEDKIYDILNDNNIAEEVDDIIDEKIEEYKKDNDDWPTIEYDSIGKWLEGSWVEEFKDEIKEW